MCESKRRRLTEEELKELEVAELLSRYNQVRSTRHIFVGNYLDLQKFISECEQAWLSIPVRDPVTRYSPEINRRLSDASRLLYNFLAVAMSLKDHTNRVVDLVFTEALYEVYEKQVKLTFTDAPLARFVQELRNYSLHRKLPLAGSQTTIQNHRPAFTTLILNKEQLLEWKGWSGIGKRFLKTQDEVVPIRPFVEDYCNKVKAFHRWLDSYFFTTFAQPIEHQQRLEIETIRSHTPEILQKFLLGQLSRRNSDILVDENWTFAID